jgi:hypothetical protein
MANPSAGSHRAERLESAAGNRPAKGYPSGMSLTGRLAVGCIPLSGHFTAKDQEGLQTAFPNNRFEIPSLLALLCKHSQEALPEAVTGETLEETRGGVSHHFVFDFLHGALRSLKFGLRIRVA